MGVHSRLLGVDFRGFMPALANAVTTMSLRKSRRERVVRRLVTDYLSNPDVPPEDWNGPNIDKAAGFHVHVYSTTFKVPEGYISNGVCTGCGKVVYPDLLDRVLAMTGRKP